MSREIVTLTSLRGLAALAVVLQHFSATAQLHAAASIPSLVPHGYLAVDLFFMLSGYIMCHSYLRQFQQRGLQAYGPFLLRRAIRLLPLNVFVVGLLLLMGLASTRLLGENIVYPAIDGLGDLLVNLFMVQGWGLGRNMNGPAWSVSAEFSAYILFPLLAGLAFNRRRWVRKGLLLVAGLGVWAVAARSPQYSLTAEDAVFGGLRCLAEFSVGMLAFRWQQSHTDQAARLQPDGVCIAVVLLFAALLPLRVDLLVCLMMPLLILALSENRGRVLHFMSRPAVYQLGLVSYSLYLMHNPFRPLALKLVQTWHPAPLSTPAALLFALLASLAIVPLAWLTYRGVELRCRRYLLRRWT